MPSAPCIRLITLMQTKTMDQVEAKLRLDTLWRRGREFLGTRHAIMGGAMSWVSERNLVAAISNSGGFGVIACGAMMPDLLTKEISATSALTSKPFGVNLQDLLQSFQSIFSWHVDIQHYDLWVMMVILI